MENLVLLSNSNVSSTVVLTRVDDGSVEIKVSFTLPASAYTSNPSNGNDNSQTVIADGNFSLVSAKLVASNSTNATTLELSGVTSSKRPGTGDGVLEKLNA